MSSQLHAATTRLARVLGMSLKSETPQFSEHIEMKLLSKKLWVSISIATEVGLTIICVTVGSLDVSAILERRVYLVAFILQVPTSIILFSAVIGGMNGRRLQAKGSRLSERVSNDK